MADTRDDSVLDSNVKDNNGGLDISVETRKRPEFIAEQVESVFLEIFVVDISRSVGQHEARL